MEVSALRARPEACDDLPVEQRDATLEELNLINLADTLELVLDDGDEDPNMLHGVCL